MRVPTALLSAWFGVVLCGAGCGPKAKPPEPTPDEILAGFPAGTIAAWKESGATFGWQGITPDGRLIFDVDRSLVLNPVAAFSRPRMSTLSAEDMRDLPTANQPFSLALSATTVTDAGLTEMKDLARLISLDVSLAAVPDSMVKRLKDCNRLVGLNLGYSSVTAAGLDGLDELTQLTTLDLSGTEVTDAKLKGLAEMKELAALRLDNTAVTDAGVQELKSLQNLTTLTCFPRPWATRD